MTRRAFSALDVRRALLLRIRVRLLSTEEAIVI